MQGTRCPTCGETRWHFTGFELIRATACHVCGTEVVPERRVPGRSRATRPTERRETDEFPVVSLDRPPAAPAV